MWHRITPNIILQNYGSLGYVQDILQPRVLPLSEGFEVCHPFISVIPWPAVSPNLSPIEHTWNYIERHVGQSTS